MVHPRSTSRPPVLRRVAAFAGLMLLAEFLAITFGYLLGQLVPGLGKENGALVVSTGAVLAVSWICTRQFERGSLRALGIGFDRPWLRHLAVGGLLGGALITLAWLAFVQLGWALWRLNPDHAGQAKLILFGLVNCLATAVFEEVLCRGYAFQVVARRNVVLALILGGLFFVGLHLMTTGGTEPLAMINVFLAHGLFAACYLRTRSLWFPIGLHAAWNFTETILLGLPYSNQHRAGSVLVTDLAPNVWTGFQFGPEGGLIGTLLVLGTALCIWRLVAQRKPADDLLAEGTADGARPPVDAGSPAVPQLPTTTPPATRVLALDVLRGVAILGILPLNMQLFALVPPAYYYPYAVDFMDSANLGLWVAVRILIGNKDLSIFSMLFGAGILMIEMHSRAAERPARLHYRRMAALLVLGLAHAYTIYFGDILFTYAVCGCIVYQLRRLLPGVQIALGIMAYLVPVALLGVAQLIAPSLPSRLMESGVQAFRPSAESAASTYAAYGGSWLEQIGQRIGDALANQTFGFALGMGWITGGMMLVGMGLFQLGFLTAERPDRDYRRLLAWGALVGYPLLLAWFAWNFGHGWQWPEGIFLCWVVREMAYGVIAFAWVGGVVLLCKRGVLTRLLHAIAAVGRLALSNYLAQSIACGLIFYGHGFGQMGRLNYIQITALTVMIWVLQLAISSIWLRYFRLGPAEWLWRRLAYGRRPARPSASVAHD